MDGKSAAHFASGLKLISDPRGTSRTISTDDHAERCRGFFKRTGFYSWQKKLELFHQLLVHALLDEVFLRDWKASSVVLMHNDASRRKAEPL